MSFPRHRFRRMSRAINLDAAVADVEALCAKHNVAISVIEPLTSGGTRVVLLNPDGADRVRTLMKAKIITATVVRSPMHMARQPVPRYR
ncbi:hypothetical protein [Sphingobium ummariense]|uniref:Uncharacterized protein n=1 Tax=Sphingobium ummariense RL-3 TaxID=1346791 RepID=T0J5C9_9SPHN|nr:hypothetical protein M529_11105 [Sphingobium ummariense RL-3]EQB33146.1 hypothetical protein M529_06340 [Sphingobium ummariense RL-3]